jgi:MFS family permease
MAEPSKHLSEAGLSHTGHSAWSPLREAQFRALWIAAVVSYTGTWIQNMASGWLMASLTMSPLMVSLVQAASSLPVFLVILPAGALADMLDRRRLLIVTQTWMVAAAAALGILTLLGYMTPWVLLAFTFLLGLGAVMNDPAWQAITPEVVSSRNFAAAVALNSVGFNVARAVGPAVGGIIIHEWGSAVAFLANAGSFLGVILFLHRWKRRPHENPMPSQRVLRAMHTGIDYSRRTPAVRSVLVRTAVFSLGGGALLALLPLIAKPFGSIGYGTMLGSFGLGALAGAVILAPVRRRIAVNRLVSLATVVFAVMTFSAGRLHTFSALCTVVFLAGGAWISILASLNVAAQTMSPAWLRARTLSMYLLVLQGGMAGGSALWGAIGQRWGIPMAMLAAAATLVAGLSTVPAFRLHADAFPIPSGTTVNGTVTSA